MEYLPPLHKKEIMHRLIVDGIKYSISHYTRCIRGTHTIASKTSVKTVVVALLFATTKKNNNVSNRALSSFIGVSWWQIKLARLTAKDLITNDSDRCALERKERKDFIRKGVEPYV